MNGSPDKTGQLKFLKDRHACVTRKKFLPFHKMCEEKYKNLDRPFLYEKYREAEPSDIDAAYDVCKE